MAVDSGDTEDYAQYYYDARNLRVRKLAGNYNRYTVYGQSGEPIEYRGTNGEWLYNLVYLNGQLLALVYPTVVEDPTDPTDPKPGGGNISSVRDAGQSDGGDDDIVLAAGGGGGETVVYTFVYYHLDHLGTPLAITDASKNIQWSADYYPFGSLYDEQLSVPNDIRFPGQWHDRETDLYYNWHRYYGPHLGRYYQPDPVGLASGDANLYRYVSNGPLGSYDPYGLFDWRAFGEGAIKGVGYTALGAGVAIGAALVLPAAIGTGVLVGAGVLGSLALGMNIGDAISGYSTGIPSLFTGSYRKMCDDERSQLWGENVVGVGSLAFAWAKVKNVKVDKPHGQMGPHIQYGQNYPNSNHPMNHFGPMAPGGGASLGSWSGWKSWIMAGSGNRPWTFK